MNSSKYGILFYTNAKDVSEQLGSITKAFSNLHSGLLAAGIDGMVARIGEGIAGMLGTFINSASKIETTRESFKFAFKDMGEGWRGVYDDVQEAGLRMVQTTDEVMNMTTMMKRMGRVNIFDPKMNEAMTKLNKDGLQFIDLMGDLASLNHYGAEGVGIALTEALQGKYTMASKRLGMGVTGGEEMKKLMNGIVDPTQKLIALAPLLYSRFGGATNALSKTWGFISAQINDIKDKLFSTFGAPMMEQLKGPIGGFVDFFVGKPNGILLRDNIHKLDGFVEGFKQIGAAITSVANMLMGLFKVVFMFVSEHPKLVSMALGFTGIATAALSVLGAVSGFSFLLGMLEPIIPMLLGIVAGFALIEQMAERAFGAHGLIDLVQRVGLVFSALVEVLSSAKDGVGQLSDENYKLLSEKGLLGIATTLMQLGYRVGVFIDGFKEEFVTIWPTIEAAFKPVMDELMKLFGDWSGAANSSDDKWKTAGKTTADTIAGMTKGLAKFLELLLKTIDEIGRLGSYAAHPWDAIKSGVTGKTFTQYRDEDKAIVGPENPMSTDTGYAEAAAAMDKGPSFGDMFRKLIHGKDYTPPGAPSRAAPTPGPDRQNRERPASQTQVHVYVDNAKTMSKSIENDRDRGFSEMSFAVP